MAQAYNAIIATITVASDATSVTKAMVKSTQWRAGTSGTWLSTDCTLTAGNTYQFRTPLSGMDSGSTAVLPNIKASVTVVWDTSATAISSVGDYFMYSYARNCSNLTSLSVPDTSRLTSVGTNFMSSYAYGCSNLTSLSVPDTSGLTSVGDYFMYAYAEDCSSLTSLDVPDTSGLTSVGNIFMGCYAEGCSNLTSLSVPDISGLTSVGTNFMGSYARYCSNLTSLSVPDTSRLTSVGNHFMSAYAFVCSSLTSLSVPDTSGITSVGTYFMSYYAGYCSSLTSLILPDSTGWFGSHNVDWNVPSGRLGYLYGYTPNSTSQTAWRALTVSGKTLYTNYIRAEDHVLLSTTPVIGAKYPLPPFRIS
jgi:hypothetical protein